MTAIVAIENIDNIDQSFTLSWDVFNGLQYDLYTAGYKYGDTATYRDLLHATLLKSGAEAAQALAIYTSGSVQNFVDKMNSKAADLDLENTHFSNPIGIEDENDDHYSTVSDVLKILKYALNNSTFKTIFTSNSYKTTNGMEFKSSKRWLGIKNLKGAKTGFTDPAGTCLSTYVSDGSVDYILVTAGATKQDNGYEPSEDAKIIYNYFYSNYGYRKIVEPKKVILTVKSKYGDNLKIKSNGYFQLYLEKDYDKSLLEIKYEGNDNLDYKIKKGDSIGIYKILYDGKIVYEETIYSPITIIRLLINKIFLVCAVEIIMLIVLINLIIKLRKRKKRLSI